MPEILAEALATPGLGWLLLAVLAGGLVRGFAGFGSGMVILPVASSVLSPVNAVMFLVMVDLIGPVPNMVPALKASARGDVGRMGFGALVAMPLGVLILSRLSPDLFGWLVSLMVLAMVVALMQGWRYRGRLTPLLVTFTGALGGLLGGAVGLAGPPVIMLYMASTLPVSVIRANLLLYLCLIDVLMLGVIGAYGMFMLAPLVTGLLLALPYMVMNRVGAALFRPGSEGLFRGVAYTIIAASAIIGLPLWQ